MQVALNILRDIVAWLSLLPSLAGVILCAIYLRRSRWAGVLLGGFALQAILSGFYNVATAFMGGGMPMDSVGVGAALLVASVLALVANGAIVAGVAGLLYELKRGEIFHATT
jgi:hypothetical protein